MTSVQILRRREQRARWRRAVSAAYGRMAGVAVLQVDYARLEVNLHVEDEISPALASASAVIAGLEAALNCAHERMTFREDVGPEEFLAVCSLCGSTKYGEQPWRLPGA